MMNSNTVYCDGARIYGYEREKTLTIISDTQSICLRVVGELAFYYYLLFNFLCYAYSRTLVVCILARLGVVLRVVWTVVVG